MNRTYTIKDIEALTSIKAHTIRIWEQRYNIVHPDRTEGNSRRYSDEQLKKIMNIAFLNKRGVKISHIAMMSNEMLYEKVKGYGAKSKNEIIDEIIEAIIVQDETKLEELIEKQITLLGFELTINSIIRPTFSQIGLLWQTGTIDTTQEHFFSAYIRNKIIVATSKLSAPTKQHSFILFLPDGELHELGLLFFNYIIKSMGFKVIYLGQAVPVEDLKMYHSIKDFDIIVTVKTNFILEENLQELINNISEGFKQKIVLVSGLQFEDKRINLPPNVKFIADSNELKNAIKHLQ